MTLKEKLLAYAELVPSGCIEWRRSLNSMGYGRVRTNNVCQLAHRAAWIEAHGAIPVGTCVLHRCDNPLCVNPEHLFLGSASDNMRDAARKGRLWSQKEPGRFRAIRHARGEGSGSAKLTEGTVRLIREAFANGATKLSLAKRFSVDHKTIRGVLDGTTWSHVS